MVEHRIRGGFASRDVKKSEPQTAVKPMGVLSMEKHNPAHELYESMLREDIRGG